MGIHQRWARNRIRSPAAFFESGFFWGKSRIRIRYEWYGVYRMYVKARNDGHGAGSESKFWRLTGSGVLDFGAGSGFGV